MGSVVVGGVCRPSLGHSQVSTGTRFDPGGEWVVSLRRVVEEDQ